MHRSGRWLRSASPLPSSHWGSDSGNLCPYRPQPGLYGPGGSCRRSPCSQVPLLLSGHAVPSFLWGRHWRSQGRNSFCGSGNVAPGCGGPSFLPMLLGGWIVQSPPQYCHRRLWPASLVCGSSARGLSPRGRNRVVELRGIHRSRMHQSDPATVIGDHGHRQSGCS